LCFHRFWRFAVAGVPAIDGALFCCGIPTVAGAPDVGKVPAVANVSVVAGEPLLLSQKSELIMYEYCEAQIRKNILVVKRVPGYSSILAQCRSGRFDD
jgi:hypothetical protein